MNKQRFAKAMGLVDDRYYEEAADYQAIKKRPVWVRWGAAAACLAVFLSVCSAALAEMGFDPLGWISSAQRRSGETPNPAMIQAQIDEGQWIWLNDGYIAVIVPETPAKILLSDDDGETWRESTVQGSDTLVLSGDIHEGVAPSGGYIGFFEDGGYLVLTFGVALGRQPMRVYLTGDGGETWAEIGNPYDAGEHQCVLTGAGFATERIGFISYRYYEDAGPDIWWTCDGGSAWRELPVTLPEKYTQGEYVFTPGSPVFDGPDGVYPIEVMDRSNDSTETIRMYSDDYGITWRFR